MNKKINLILAAFLLGGLTTVFPILWKIIVFTGVAVSLFMTYDKFSYSMDHKSVGGAKHD